MSTLAPTEPLGLLRPANLLLIVIAVLLGVMLGLAFTINSLELDRRGIANGPWRSTPRDNAGDSDPYALAADARAGLLPLGVAEGLSFTAATDSSGAVLEARCEYTVVGPMPPTRYWSLSLLDPRGFPVGNTADRYGFTSADILRIAGQPVTITVASHARSGNWLPVGAVRDFKLMLRLYDTTLTTGGNALDKVTLPTIRRGACR